ncbi:MAG: histidinol-phosphate transaminase [Deltaproteobacteria bacterium]|nr:histidinol-phosphate transaminase [Deltaproteobacteria bacterium]
MKVPDYIAGLKAYVPGKPIEELEREYGIASPVKLASNENALGPSPKAVEAIREALRDLHRYPDGYSFRLREKLAEKLSVSEEEIVFGNGSNEIIELLARTFLRPGDEVVMPAPSFLMYEIMVQASGARPVKVPLKGLHVDLEGLASRLTPATRMVFVNNPNNPTGTVISRTQFEQFLKMIPADVLVVVDEAYAEFVRDPHCARGLDYLHGDNEVVILRTFSKAYGLAGLRIGYGVMQKAVADVMNRVRQPFNVNSLAQIGALAALNDTAFFQETIRLVHQELDRLYAEMDRLGLAYLPSQANFFLIDVGIDARVVFENMLRKGVIVRAMTAYGYPTYIRITVGLPKENRRFVKALEEILNP